MSLILINFIPARVFHLCTISSYSKSYLLVGILSWTKLISYNSSCLFFHISHFPGRNFVESERDHVIVVCISGSFHSFFPGMVSSLLTKKTEEYQLLGKREEADAIYCMSVPGLRYFSTMTKPALAQLSPPCHSNFKWEFASSDKIFCDIFIN